MGELKRVKVAELVKAPWNYKTDGTPETIGRLARSIKEDGSPGVFAVRRLKNKYEVMDGNHRLDAVKLLKWEETWVEDFGVITDAKAASIAVRRNNQWFEDDPVKLSVLMSEVVFPQWAPEEFAEMTVHSLPELRAMEELGSWDWTNVQRVRKSVERAEGCTIHLQRDQATAWLEYKVRSQEEDDVAALMKLIGRPDLSGEPEPEKPSDVEEPSNGSPPKKRQRKKGGES